MELKGVVLSGARNVGEDLWRVRGAWGRSREEGAGEDAMTYLGGIPPPDFRLWLLCSAHVKESLEVLVLRLQCYSIG